MRLFLAVGIIAYSASWFLPALDMPELAGLRNWTKGLGEEMAKSMPQLGADPKMGGAGIDFGKLGVPEAKSGIKGHDAAEAIFDAMRDVFKSKAKTSERLRAIWWNLANPLFVFAILAAYFRKNALVALFATFGAVSAGYWVVASDLPTENLGIGYWLWFGSFVEVALAGWLASFSSTPSSR